MQIHSRLFPLLVMAVAPLVAHDMWIEPATFSPAAGQIVAVKLRVGQDLLGDPLPRDPALIQQFLFDDGSGPKPVVGCAGADPAGYLRVEAPGLLVVGYRSHASAVELGAEKFNQYLKDEGLDAILALRSSRKQASVGGRELFSRCAKSLVLSGAASSTQHDRNLGFTLELVAERNPYLLRESELLPVRLTYEGRALAGALVVAINRLNPAERLTARTDRDGRVRFRLRSRGMWMIKSVHMLPGDAGSGADWRSYWASLTFELRDATARGK